MNAIRLLSIGVSSRNRLPVNAYVLRGSASSGLVKQERTASDCKDNPNAHLYRLVSRRNMTYLTRESPPVRIRILPLDHLNVSLDAPPYFVQPIRQISFGSKEQITVHFAST